MTCAKKSLARTWKEEIAPVSMWTSENFVWKQKMPHRRPESNQISFRKLHAPKFSKFSGGRFRLVVLVCVLVCLFWGFF